MKKLKEYKRFEIIGDYPCFGVEDKDAEIVIIPSIYQEICFKEKYIEAIYKDWRTIYSYDGEIIIKTVYCNRILGKILYVSDVIIFVNVIDLLFGNNKKYEIYNCKGEKIIETLGCDISFTKTQIIITKQIENNQGERECISNIYNYNGKINKIK